MTQKTPIMLIFTIFSATNHLGLTTSPPIKAINKLHILRPHTKIGSTSMKGTADLYYIYISPFTTSHTCPFGYTPHALDSHYRITPIAAEQNKISPSAKKETQTN